MDEKLSTNQEHQLKENDILSEWLGESRFAVRIIGDIDDALSVLAMKRSTLEEKIISKELHALAANYGNILADVHGKLAAEQAPAPVALEDWRTLNFSVHEALEPLLKALRYNLNYVEQYFEFDYCARLTNDWQFAAEAARIAAVLKG